MTHSSTDEIAEALKLLEHAAKQKKDELRSALTNKYAHLRSFLAEGETCLSDSLSGIGKRAVEAAAQARDAGVDKARELAEGVDKNVHGHPWSYIGGMAAVGLVFGYILGRNRASSNGA